jgi:serine/threonine protein phosphatase PrpC
MGMLTSTVAILHNNTAHGDDNYLVRPLGDYACIDAVMDGVTGRRGREASQAVREALTAAPLTSPDDVVAVLQGVNQALYQRGWGHWRLTTVSVAMVLDGILSVVGIGDSPVFLIRSATCQPLFGPSSGFGQAGMIRTLGSSPTVVNLYRAEVVLMPGDRVVLATDGVTANVTRPELVGIIQSAASPDAAAAQLTSLIATRRAEASLPVPTGRGFQHDDWTAVVRFFSPADRLTTPSPAPTTPSATALEPLAPPSS